MKNNKKVIASSENIYFKTDSLVIFCEDFLKTKSISPNSVDLIITSPPYNLDIKYNSFDDRKKFSI